MTDAVLRAGIRGACARRLRREQRRSRPSAGPSSTACAAHGSRSRWTRRTSSTTSSRRSSSSSCSARVSSTARCYWPRRRRRRWRRRRRRCSRSPAQRAGIADGMEILDLGCGWGSLSLWLAERYPGARGRSRVSNSRAAARVHRGARRRGCRSRRPPTSTTSRPSGRFDRVVSIEMFEHMRNYEALLARVASLLEPGGRLFVHVFSHREFAYPLRRHAGWRGASSPPA